MLDFEVQKCTRRCAKTERDLQPGEFFYSVLIAEGASVVRYDFCKEAWDGPRDNIIGWWKSQMPDRHTHKLHWAPNDVMLHYFKELAEHEDQQDLCYVLALLMIRRRILRLEESERDDDGHEVLVLYCPRKETEFHVRVFDPDQTRIQQIQEELARMLFARAA